MGFTYKIVLKGKPTQLFIEQITAHNFNIYNRKVFCLYIKNFFYDYYHINENN